MKYESSNFESENTTSIKSGMNSGRATRITARVMVTRILPLDSVSVSRSIVYFRPYYVELVVDLDSRFLSAVPLSHFRNLDRAIISVAINI